MQLTVKIPDDYDEKIVVIAENMGLEKSDLARLALKQFIEENIGEDRDTPYQKVRHLIGTAESGIRDLGQSHHHYLMKKIGKTSV